MSTRPDALTELKLRLREFAHERDWEKFHNPKNLAMALAVEAAELMEPLQWLTLEEAETVTTDEATTSGIKGELADVLIYLVRLADVLEVDLLQAATDKVAENAERFPAPSRR